MNAAQKHNQSSAEMAGAAANAMGSEVALSALADGEISETDLGALLASFEGSQDKLSDWHAFQVIGDVLRGHQASTGSKSTTDFLAAVRLGIQAQDAGTAAVASQPVELATNRFEHQGEAANDAVFRWKLVAGFASLAAVMAVSWSVLLGSGGVPVGSGGAQLADGSSGAVPVPALQTASVMPVNAPVAVRTDQGVLIRDAQLEALLAEHRHHGGMSALQMPSGFIRNATYDATER